jgi:hypothetical protein
MHFEDLSPYTYSLPKDLPEGADIGSLAGVLNIGWLGAGHAFDVGPTPWGFRWKLRKLARDVKNPAWGYHECDLCEGRRRKRLGNGEIHVTGSNGIMYVAPELIVHYIGKHKYLPPQTFIDAVLTSVR